MAKHCNPLNPGGGCLLGGEPQIPGRALAEVWSRRPSVRGVSSGTCAPGGRLGWNHTGS